jgi:hypothetical protein
MADDVYMSLCDRGKAEMLGYLVDGFCNIVW